MTSNSYRLKNLLSFIILFFIITLALSSCEKPELSVNSPQNYPGDNYPQLFESFWNGMNNNYVFWSADTTNWDRVYKKYKPLFAKLTLFNNENDSLAEMYFEQMTQNLIDSHYTITFSNTGHQISPSLKRKLNIQKNHPDSIYSLPLDFFTSLVAKNYIDPSTLKAGTDTIYNQDETIPFTAVSGTINSNILYLYVNGFFFSQASVNVAPVISSFFTLMYNLQPSIKGVIIDVRENSGGNISDLNFLLGRMIRSPLAFGYTRGKSNIGRLDYTPWAPAIVTPQPGSIRISQPIVVLADHLSVSLAESIALAVQGLPNGKFIGTTTWGANGPLTPNLYFNGGQFTIGTSTFGPNGYMFVYTSSVMFKSVTGKMYEGIGVPPDIWVPETYQAYQAGNDLQLNTAIAYIKSK
jgi:carboxyl-terminal processing protease